MNRVPGYLLVGLALLLTTCIGSGDRKSDKGTGVNPDGGCDGNCQDTATRLQVDDVERIIAQAVGEAEARNAPATIAVVDRVGNVLGLFRMNGADEFVTIESERDITGGLENIEFIPDTLAAIAKAMTGAYLSSEGNAFTTRSASQIIQEHFNPGEFDQPGGPLFGVQFSQLACSDLSARFDDGTGPGPFRSPLGLAGDPGGLPLYINGTVVGGIGVMADGVYGLDEKGLKPDDFSIRDEVDELIATAGSFGYAAPRDRRSDRITVDGKVLLFAEVDFDDLRSKPHNAAAFADIHGPAGVLVDDGPPQAYFNADDGINSILAGTAFAHADSGIRPSTRATFSGQDAFELVDDQGAPRFAPSAGTALTEQEVEILLSEALTIANRARAQIRRPLGSQARVTIAVTDTNGDILGIIRSRDAPVFGTDVAVQKARTASFMSSADAADALRGVPAAEYLEPTLGPSVLREVDIGDYVDDLQDFLGLDNALADGAFAFADRSGGNLSRPFFPDGLTSGPHGPLSKPFNQWSPFTTGLQLDVSYNAIVQHVAFAAGLGPPDTEQNCTGVRGLVDNVATGNFDPENEIGALANGLQIFPGSVPIYRNDQLIGGIGISGDGIEQDDMIAFLGLHEAGRRLGSINNAPKDMRADRIELPGSLEDLRLRYVQCPQAPFLNSNEQKPCSGK